MLDRTNVTPSSVISFSNLKTISQNYKHIYIWKKEIQHDAFSFKARIASSSFSTEDIARAVEFFFQEKKATYSLCIVTDTRENDAFHYLFLRSSFLQKGPTRSFIKTFLQNTTLFPGKNLSRGEAQ